MSDSVVFDRAAEYYDRTRALSPEAHAAVLALLRAEFAGRQRALEVGVGTGRIALPLFEAGVRIAGVDLSRPMLDRLAEKAGGRAPFPVAIADAVALPFPDRTFEAAYVVHVLHLIPAWRVAVEEMVRVLCPGGLILVDHGGWKGSTGEIQDHFAAEAGLVRSQPGLAFEELGELDDLMAGFGGYLRMLPQVVDERDATLADFIDGLERGEYSWTWSVPEQIRLRAAGRTRAWAEERFGPLATTRQPHDSIHWRAYDFP